MFSLFSNKKEGVRSIILDIQSGVVRGAVVLNVPNEPTRVLSVVTRSLSPKAHTINTTHLTKKVLKLVSEVIDHLATNTEKPISKIDYMLSTPWVFSKLKTIKIEYDEETVTTPKVFDKIVKEELESGLTTKDVYPIEQNIFEIKLNGYSTFIYENKKAHKFEVSLSTSFASHSFLNKVNEIVKKHLHIKNHKPHSALIMQYTALREIFKDKHEFIYIHVHNEITDIVVIQDTICKHISSFPFGISTLLRKISTETKQDIEASNSLVSLYQGDKLSDTEKNRVQKIIEPLTQEWSDLCVKSFEDVFDLTNIPKNVYLSAHSHYDLFKLALSMKNKFNFNISSYDSIDIGDSVVFDQVAEKSNMIKIYALALSNMV